MTPDPNFQPTRWSLIAHAASPNHPRAAIALEKLCADYWYPVFAAVRRHGYSEHDAQDLTQSFFLMALEKDTFSKASEEKGRFRTYVLACLRYFIGDEYARATAAKRDSRQLVAIDFLSAEERYLAEGVDGLSPDKLFERTLALEVLRKSEVLLEEEFRQKGEINLYLALKPSLYEADDSEPQASLATRLNLTPAALTSRLHKLRQKQRDILRRLADDIVTHPEDAKDELIQLQKAI